MSKVEKAYAISDAKISFVSLVDKAANKRQFIITKADDGVASFQSTGKILKTDKDSHYVTGIVYEPMVEDSQGNYMTEEEITKAAHWFMKNAGDVDIQHCFEKAKDCEVVESFVAKSDMEIEGIAIKKGTWLMTTEITNQDVWEKVEKGDITGFSMGGVGVYAEEDIDISKSGNAEEPRGIIQSLAKLFGLDVVEKGKVKNKYLKRSKADNFYAAWHALKEALEGSMYDPETGSWEYGYIQDEEVVKGALEDFNDIVTQLLTSDEGIVKSLNKFSKERDLLKAGKSLSSKNLQALKDIHNSLNDFLSSFEEEDKKGSKNKEEDMNKEDVEKLVTEKVEKALESINDKIDEIAKSYNGNDKPEDDNSDISAFIDEKIAKAVEPIGSKLDELLKSRGLSSNLNEQADDVIKSTEAHYMKGIF